MTVAWYFFVREHIYLQISPHAFYCIRCTLQVSTYVLCFQHDFTIGIILSAAERHIHGFLVMECNEEIIIVVIPVNRGSYA